MCTVFADVQRGLVVCKIMSDECVLVGLIHCCLSGRLENSLLTSLTVSCFACWTLLLTEKNAFIIIIIVSAGLLLRNCSPIDTMKLVGSKVICQASHVIGLLGYF